MDGGVLPSSPMHGQQVSQAEVASQDPDKPYPTSPSSSSHPIDSDPSALTTSDDPSDPSLPTSSSDSVPLFSAPTFSPSSDYRLSFLGELAVTSLNVGLDVWEAFLAEGGNQSKLIDFCEKKEEGAVLLLHTREDEQHRRIHFADSAIPDLPASSPSSSSPPSPLPPSTPESLYLLKASPSPILRPTSAAQASELMSSFEYGVLPSNQLLLLHQLIREVFLPLADPDNSTVDGVGSRSTADDRPTSMMSGRHGGTDAGSASRPMGSTGYIGAGVSEKDEAVDEQRVELASNLHKFASQLSHALQQVNGSIRLPMPVLAHPLTPTTSLGPLAADPLVLQAIEHAMDEWITIISQVLEGEQRKRAPGHDPLSEIGFWRDRNAVLSGLYEQLQDGEVKAVIRISEMASLTSCDLFERHVSELLKLYVEAKDNVKFLVTLERHFKSLQSGQLTAMLDTIPSMMNSLRMVWVISRHFNKDARMFPLMERIAKTIAEKVARELNVRSIFRRKPDEVIRTISRGKEVLETWHNAYMSMREKIEQSGTDRRWEFNRQKLFDQTGYMVKICEHLLEVAMTIEQFSQFLGPELKAVTGDSHGIDDVSARVKALIRPLEHLSYNLFDQRNAGHWEDQMKVFHQSVEEIEQRTKAFIDSSFQRLRSAEGAFDLLQNFKTIQARDSIAKQMMMKFTDILLQYSKEVERIKRTFEAGEAAPPISKNQPPIAGAIAWTRALYFRVKKSVLKFQTMPALLASDQGKAVCKEYVVVARMIHRYQEALIDGWRERVTEVASKRLKEFIFRYADGGPPHISTLGYQHEEKTAAVVPLRMAPVPHGGQANSSTSSSTTSSYLSKRGGGLPQSSGLSSSSKKSATSANASMSNRSFMRSSRVAGGSSKSVSAQQYALQHRRVSPSVAWIDRKVIVNFSPELTAIIKETRYLDRLSIPIPEVARSVALQEKKYYNLCEQLHAMLRCYEAVIGRLSHVEKQLLARRIADLHRIMAPGFDPLNWNSLSIPVFIEACQRGISQLETLVNSVQKNSDLIHKLVASVKRSTLVDASAFLHRTAVLSVEDLNDRLDAFRSRQVDDLLKKVASMGPLLRIIEMHVSETESGRSDEMFDYYRYWEKRMFMAITAAIATGMRDFQSLLLRRTSPTLSQPNHRPLPLVGVTAEMSPPNLITVTPNIQDIYKLLSKLLRNIPESSKHFIRWMAGTCIECSAISVGGSTGVGGDEEVIVYTFYDDLSKNPLIVPLMLTVTQSIQKTIHQVDRFIDSFSQYHTAYQLWNPKKVAALERFRSKANIPTAYFDRQLDRYTQLCVNMERVAEYKDVEFIRIDCRPLIGAIQRQAREWVNRYADILHTQAAAQLTAIYANISSLVQRVASSTEGIDELKFVLNVIREIRQSNLAMELQFNEVQDKYAVLSRYGIDVPEDERRRVAALQSTWAQLLAQAAERDGSLNAVKENFTVITGQQITAFLDRIHTIRERFDAEGPGSDVGLDEGLELMKAYEADLQELLRQKDVLATSEKLFNLPQTSFTDLYYLQERMVELSLVYTLYGQHVESVKQWSGIMWAELEVGVFNRGLAGYTKELKRMGDKLGAGHVTFKKLNGRMTAFRESIPLLLSLKTDALRERHWKELMRSTGVKFEFDSKSFTLGSLFAMELHRYKDDIVRIVSNAQQEAKIERDISKLAKQWSTESFALQPFDGDESRGYILSDVSEILQTLEDHSLSLQAMANSPFASPFLSELRGWEQRCNHIAETLSIWMVVQKRWMYLEGIFLKSDDIRMQLPEPAKKFDRVDLSFKKIMQQTLKQPNVLVATSIEHRIDDLRALAQELDKCQKSLSDYLERKRHAFPRFFFISDDELLSILGQSSPLCVQVHMLKLFQCCKELRFTRGEGAVVGMSAGADEEFEFRTAVSTEGAVENWMGGVEAEMKATLQVMTKEAVFHYANADRLQWINAQLQMIGISGSQIWWTWEVENAFKKVKDGHKHAMKELAAKLSTQLTDLVTAIRDPAIGRAERKKLNTLIIIDVHARDIIDRFVRDSILDAREFDWESQLRFYWDRELDDMAIKQCTGAFRFGYEYTLDARLVITPLTDRCYMTLTQALTFHMGGSPSGPAGTGKTETVKGESSTPTAHGQASIAATASIDSF